MREQEQEWIALKAGMVLQERYVIEERIGRGGFGITYRARDLRVDVPVAVKEYLPQRQLNKKDAQRETKMAAKFYGLEGIAAARDFFTEGEHAYIIMDYVSGMSVKQYIRENGRMSGGVVLKKIRPIIKTLAKIHQEGVIHRDISSDNLMITDDGELKLIDFGTARFSGEYERNPHTLIFKRGFAPLEQCRTKGKQGPWTDVYALCATVYFMIMGLVPDDSVERALNDTMKSLCQTQGTGLDSHQAACIMKGLEVQPEDRYQSMEALYEDLYGERKAAGTEENESWKPRHFTTEFRTTTFFQELKEIGRGRKRKKGFVIAGMGLLAVVVLFGMIVLLKLKGVGGMASASLPASSSQREQLDMSVSGEAAAAQSGESDVVQAGEHDVVPDGKDDVVLTGKDGRPGEIGETPSPSGTVKGEGYEIGNYTGLTRKQAENKTAALRKAGLKLRFETKYSKKAKGTVISQTLKAGSIYPDFEKVSLVLVVSKGKKPSPTAAPTRTPRAPHDTRENSSGKPKGKNKPEIDFSGNLDDMLGD